MAVFPWSGQKLKVHPGGRPDVAAFGLMAAARCRGHRKRRSLLEVEPPKLGARWLVPAGKYWLASRIHNVNSCFCEGHSAIGVTEIADAYYHMFEAGHDMAIPCRSRWERRKV